MGHIYHLPKPRTRAVNKGSRVTHQIQNGDNLFGLCR